MGCSCWGINLSVKCKMIAKKNTCLAEGFWRDVTTLGSGFFSLAVLFLLLLLNEYELLVKLTVGFFFTIFVVALIRTFYFKNRPQKQEFKGFIERIDASSFPSLHTARVVFLTLSMVDVLNNTNNVKLILFLVIFALLGIYSRIYLKRHDWNDIVGGIILGVFTWWGAALLF